MIQDLQIRDNDATVLSSDLLGVGALPFIPTDSECSVVCLPSHICLVSALLLLLQSRPCRYIEYLTSFPTLLICFTILQLREHHWTW